MGLGNSKKKPLESFERKYARKLTEWKKKSKGDGENKAEWTARKGDVEAKRRRWKVREGNRRRWKMLCTSSGALSASSSTRTWPWRTAETSGESRQCMEESMRVGSTVRDCTVESCRPIDAWRGTAREQGALGRSVGRDDCRGTGVGSQSRTRCSCMYCRSRLLSCSSRSASLFLPVPWLPMSSSARSPHARSSAIPSSSRR